MGWLTSSKFSRLLLFQVLDFQLPGEDARLSSRLQITHSVFNYMAQVIP